MSDSFQQAVDDSQRSELRSIRELLGSVVEQIKINRQETREQFNDLRGEMRESLAKVNNRLDKHDEEITILKVDTAKIKERQSIMAVIQVGYSTIASFIAAWLGRL